ncbi:UxaA family hydrolase (plasmid) [Haloferacaceae archaeon DSL9]
MKGEVLGGLGLHMAETDNVVTAIDDLETGATIPTADETIEVGEDVPFGHKIAIVPIERGERIVKYGETIGEASEPIDPGEWVHTHNCESTRGRGDLADATGGSA